MAVAAAAGGVTIHNFAFGPSSIVVNVGDTVTWTNQDGVAHTATARDGSFDTGNIGPSRSGSHTFTTAGTFAYVCSIHPFMHGTVVVRGASSGTSGSGSRTGSASTSTPATAAASPGSAGSAAAPAGSAAAQLPRTGFELGAVIAIAAGMLVARSSAEAPHEVIARPGGYRSAARGRSWG